MKQLKNILLIALALAIVVLAIKQCNTEPKVITKTKIEYVKVTDTITETKIDTVAKTIYVERIKTVKGKDSIIYRDKPTPGTFPANQYDTQLKSNNATADLKITTTGKLLDVTGTINQTQTNTITEITKTVPQSGLFLYGETSVNPFFERAAIGLDYQFKNAFLVGASASYNNVSKSAYLNVKLGFSLFKTK